VLALEIVDEHQIAALHSGVRRGEIARAVEHRAGSLEQIHAELGRDDVGEGRLSEAGRAENQHVIERFAALPGGSDEDYELGFHRQLADVLLEPARPDGPLDRLLVGGRRATDDAFGCHGYDIYSRAAPCRARRISSSVECVPGPTALSKRAASAGR